MNREKENIDSLIERVVLIVILSFVLFAFKTIVTPENDSFKSAATIEYVLENDNSAILAESVSYSTIIFSPGLCELNSFVFCDCNSFKIRYFNSRTNLLFRIGSDKFLKIKPQILTIYTCLFFTSLNGEGLPLIS